MIEAPKHQTLVSVLRAQPFAVVRHSVSKSPLDGALT